MRGQGTLHIIQAGSGCTIAVFPAERLARYIPDEEDTGEHHTETWEELPNTVRTVIEAKSKQLSNEQFHSVADDANPYRTHRNAAKHNKSGNR